MAKHSFTVYKLHFTSPLHIGDARDDYSVSLQTVASDTLYAALTSCLAKFGEAVPNDGDLGFTISSLFPFYQKERDKEGEDTAVYFFPKPLKQRLPELKNIDDRKKIKKVAWLDQDYFSKVLKGETLFGIDSNDAQNINGSFLTTSRIDSSFISSQVSQRVKVSRDGKEDAVPFYMDRVCFKDYSGLFFMAEGNCEMLDKAINRLQYEGIGTDRNVGNGYFECEKKDVELDLPDEADFTMSLSSFIPESKGQLQDLISSNEVAYDFQRRGGWVTTPPYNTVRKNVVYAFAYGSVFRKPVRKIETLGRFVNLKPRSVNIDHPIWRCGRALFVPINLK